MSDLKARMAKQAEQASAVAAVPVAAAFENAPEPEAKPKREPLRRITLNIPESMYRDYRRGAYESETTMTELMVNALDKGRPGE